MGAPTNSVSVIGAGPVGLFLALSLVQAEIEVDIFERAYEVSESPRALAYFPTVLAEFRKVGILEALIEQGHVNEQGVDWRDASQNILGGIRPPPGVTILQLGQPEVTRIMLDRVLASGKARVHFGHQFVSATDHPDSILVDIQDCAQDRIFQHRAAFLIGCDGGRSSVRRSRNITFDGFTWDSLPLIAVNMVYDLERFGWKPANYVVDPEHWAVVAKLGKGSLWRIATCALRGAEKAESEAQIKALVMERCRRILPGNVEEIEIKAATPYAIHQRCAARFRDGRVLLAGDTAHINNPVGGLGLTTGLLDAAHLSQALTAVIAHGQM